MKKTYLLSIVTIICTLCLCGCSGVADKSGAVETTDSTKTDVEVAEEEFVYLGRPGDKNSRAGDKISWKFEEEEGETVTVYVESHKRELSGLTQNKELQKTWNDTRKRLEDFDSVFWDLEALYDQDAPICFYGGKKCTDHEFNDYVINMLKGTRFECKSVIETSVSVPLDSTGGGKRHITRSYPVPQTVLKKVIREARYGDRDAWLLLERFVLDSNRKAGRLSRILILAFSPKKEHILFVNDMGGDQRKGSCGYSNSMKEIPFAAILLEGHVRDVSDGNISFLNLTNGSSELDFLDRLYDRNLKITQD